MTDFSHVDEHGHARMVDITEKAVAPREAVAAGTVWMAPATLERIRRHDVAKGDVLAVARLAGIQGAKLTSQLIPLCHPILTTSVAIELVLHDPDQVLVTATVRSTAQTGPEMEAMTAVSSACLALYDMCKGIDKTIVLGDMRLLSKRGGKSGHWERPTTR